MNHPSRRWLLAAAVAAALAGCNSDDSKDTQGYSETPFSDGVVTSVEEHLLIAPKGEYVGYKGGAFAANFPDGFPPAIGSGLWFDGVNAQGELMFVSLTDRGPNGDTPGSVDGLATKMFPVPDFTPRLYRSHFEPGTRLKLDAGKPLSQMESGLIAPIDGLPLPANTVGTTKEQALDDHLLGLGYTTTHGLDPEGIVSDGAGGYWICDEYGPFIAHIDANGTIAEKFGPAQSGSEASVTEGLLPAILKKRTPNRGFEGIARNADTGRVYAVVQSTLNIGTAAPFTRIVEFDPATRTTRQFAYPIDPALYKKTKDAKLGDLVWVAGDRFVMIEQGTTRNLDANGKAVFHNSLYLLDLGAASDITPLSVTADVTKDNVDNPVAIDLEWIGSSDVNNSKIAAPAGLAYVAKRKLLDLRSYGWQPEKAEGLALVDDDTIAVINDNDFGLATKVENPVGEADEVGDYQVNPADGSLALAEDGSPAATTRITLVRNGAGEHETRLWLIHLAKPLSSLSIP